MSIRGAWQRQIWELEGQVRDLKTEVEELRAADARGEFCSACGRGAAARPSPVGSDDGSPSPRTPEDVRRAAGGGKAGGVVNRPRARTGINSRFAA